MLPLVVGVDGSEQSLGAVDWAVDEAMRHGTALRVLYANLWERYETVRAPGGSTVRALSQDIVTTASERAEKRNPAVPVETEVSPQDPELALLEAGKNAHALVIGARGRGTFAGLLLGSTSLGVAARAQCPVFVVRGQPAALEGRHRRVLVGVDGSPEGDAAIAFAFHEAELRGVSLEAISAWRDPEDAPSADGRPGSGPGQQASSALEDALRDTVRRHPGVVVSRTLSEGSARSALLERTAEADLIVLGALRRRGPHPPGLQIGRVGLSALHHALCPVAMVPERR